MSGIESLLSRMSFAHRADSKGGGDSSPRGSRPTSPPAHHNGGEAGGGGGNPVVRPSSSFSPFRGRKISASGGPDPYDPHTATAAPSDPSASPFGLMSLAPARSASGRSPSGPGSPATSPPPTASRGRAAVLEGPIRCIHVAGPFAWISSGKADGAAITLWSTTSYVVGV